MPDSPPGRPSDAGDNPVLSALLMDQHLRWQHGERVPVEASLAQYPHLRGDADAVLQLIQNEIHRRKEIGEDPTLSEYLDRFPHLSEQLSARFEIERTVKGEPPPLSTL